MSDYLLDTNVLMHLVNKTDGWQNIETRLNELGSKRPFISAVTVWEITSKTSRTNGKMKKAAIVTLQSLLTTFKVVPLMDQYAALGGSVYGTLANKGETMGDMDSMIAGTAMALDLILVTDDHGFDRVRSLTIQNWRRPN